MTLVFDKEIEEIQIKFKNLDADESWLMMLPSEYLNELQSVVN
jgi:hypothetical protein